MKEWCFSLDVCKKCVENARATDLRSRTVLSRLGVYTLGVYTLGLYKGRFPISGPRDFRATDLGSGTVPTRPKETMYRTLQSTCCFENAIF